MKTIKLEVYVSTNRSGSEVRDTIEVDIEDDYTQEDIEEALEETAKEWMFNNIEWSWVRV